MPYIANQKKTDVSIVISERIDFLSQKALLMTECLIF